MSTKLAEEARIEAEAAASLDNLANAPEQSFTGLKDALKRAEAIPASAVQPPLGGKTSADYRPRNAIPMKEIVVAKLAGLENEQVTSRKVLEQKKDELLNVKREIENMMREAGRLGREIHDLEMMLFLDDITARSLARDHVSE